MVPDQLIDEGEEGGRVQAPLGRTLNVIQLQSPFHQFWVKVLLEEEGPLER